MKRIGPVAFLLVGGVLVYLYMTGKLAGVTSGADTSGAGAAAGQGIQKAKDTGSAIYAQPWFWAAAFAAVGATLVRWLWKNMNGPVRGAVIVVTTIAAVIFVTTVVKR